MGIEIKVSLTIRLPLGLFSNLEKYYHHSDLAYPLPVQFSSTPDIRLGVISLPLGSNPQCPVPLTGR
jgi:hypothetical protein